MSKKLIIMTLSLMLFGLPLYAQPKKGFTIKGNLSGLKESTVYFGYMNYGTQKLDTVQVKNGSFIIKGSVPEPGEAIIYSAKDRFQRLFFLDNSEITLQGDIANPLQIKVTGSKNQDEYEKLQADIQNNRNDVIKASELSDKAEKDGDSSVQKKYKLLSDSLYQYEQVIIKRFIKEHPQSYLSASRLFYLIVEKNLDECKALYESFAPVIKQSYVGKEIATRFATLGKVQIGKTAMDFTQKDTLGNPVKLSSYKGKYVLLEFWASWCGPCRAEGPNLLKAYEKFKDKGLVIVAVSLDKDMKSWKKAINEDHLPWIHVSDLKYWKNEVAEQYGVHAVPANFLISPDGKIIAKDLRGEVLHKKLAEILP